MNLEPGTGTWNLRLRFPGCSRFGEAAVAVRRCALDRIAVHAGGRWLALGAREQALHARPASLPVSQRHEADAEDGAAWKTVNGDAVARDHTSAAHLDQPGCRLDARVAHERITLLVEGHEHDLQMTAVRVDSLHHTGEDVGDRAIV